MKTLLMLAIILPLAVGCATVTRGSTDTLIVQSEPIGADVSISNGMKGQTPATFTLDRDAEVIVNIQKEGYEPVVVEIKPQMSTAGGTGFAGNVLVGGLIGMGVDAATGAMYDLTPNPVAVRLIALNNDAGTEQVQPPMAPQAQTTSEKKAVVTQPAPSTTASSKPAGSQSASGNKDTEARLQALRERRLRGEMTGAEYLAEKEQIQKGG